MINYYLENLRNLLLTATQSKRVYQKQFDRDRRELLLAIKTLETLAQSVPMSVPKQKVAELADYYMSGVFVLTTGLEEFIHTYSGMRVNNQVEIRACLVDLQVFHKTSSVIDFSKGFPEEDSEQAKTFLSMFPVSLRSVNKKIEARKFRMLPGFGKDVAPNEEVSQQEEVTGTTTLEFLEKKLMTEQPNDFEHLDDTPSSRWSLDGESDPHPNLVGKKRKDLALGQLTDDELANACFLCDHRTSLNSVGYLMAVKDRIRWLSRELERQKALNQALIDREHEALHK